MRASRSSRSTRTRCRQIGRDKLERAIGEAALAAKLYRALIAVRDRHKRFDGKPLLLVARYLEALLAYEGGAVAPDASINVPVCVSGQCSLIDVRQTPLTVCNTDTDCILHGGSTCRGACDTSGFIGANKSARSCDTQGLVCPNCETSPPGILFTGCIQGK